MSARDRAERSGYRVGLADVIVAIVVGFLFAASLWAAIGNLVGLPEVLGAGKAPWVPLVASVALPVVLFVAALLLGRGRASFPRALILIVALAANSAVSLSLYFAALSQIAVVR